jgi:hypothetical protein
MKNGVLIITFLASRLALVGQTIGGSSVFNFLNLPNTAQLTALGGVNISNLTNDVGLAFNNPALLREEMHGQVNTVFNNMYAGIKNFHVSGAYTASKLQTNFSAGIHYLNYGSIQQTDAAGNLLGSFRPGDYVVQVSASRKYLQHWHYGAGFKFINSNYGLYKSNGVALDAGLSYYDTANAWQASLVMKNMGFQLRQYSGTRGDDLPFDLEIGITKRLQKAPVQFSVTAHHLQQFNIRYNDSVYNNENGFDNINKGNLPDQLARHLVFATQVYVGEKLELTAAYNYLRRKELNIDHTANGFTGFSLGLGVLFKKLDLRYARGYYQNNRGYNQFGLNMKFL